MILLNDTELLEGFTGAIGFILFNVFLRNYLSVDPTLELFVAWGIVWYFRKMINNIYIHKLKKRGIQLGHVSL